VHTIKALPVATEYGRFTCVDKRRNAPALKVRCDVFVNADLIIAKGMANFESLSETDIAPIAYLLRTKCEPVANAMGLKKDINAVKLFKKVRGK
jgi:hypothetical protein